MSAPRLQGSIVFSPSIIHGCSSNVRYVLWNLQVPCSEAAETDGGTSAVLLKVTGGGFEGVNASSEGGGRGDLISKVIVINKEVGDATQEKHLVPQKPGMTPRFISFKQI